MNPYPLKNKLCLWEKMAGITRMDIFVSRHSRHSQECVQLLSSKFGITPNVIPLDTPADRARAIKGSYLSIKQVPSLAVVGRSGEVDVFIGKIKILRWAQSMSRSIAPPPAQQPYESVSEPSAPPNQTNPDSMYQTVVPAEQPEVHVEIEDTETEMAGVESVPTAAPSTLGLETGAAASRPPGKMVSVKDMAKQMRQASGLPGS